MYLLAQLCGLGAMIALFSVYQQSTRQRLLISKLCADVCWVAHYLLTPGGVGGAIPNFIGIFRELIFIQREKKSWANKIIWPLLCILCGWILGIFSFKDAWNILPITASTFVTISLWLKNPRLTKLVSIPVVICFLIYNIHLQSPVAIVNESLSLVSIFLSFGKEHLHKKECLK